MSMYVYVHGSVCISFSVVVFIYMSLCELELMSEMLLHVYGCFCVSVYKCVCVYGLVCVCAVEGVYLFLRICVSMCLLTDCKCFCVHTFSSFYVCVSVCVFLSARVCMFCP